MIKRKEFHKLGELFKVVQYSFEFITEFYTTISYAEMDNVHENERNMKPPTYQQLDRPVNAFVGNSSTSSFWVSLLHESINLNFQVNADFERREISNTYCLPSFEFM